MARIQNKAARTNMMESLEGRQMFSTYGTVNISLTAITPSVVVDYTRKGVDQSWGAGEFVWSRSSTDPGTYKNKAATNGMLTFCIEPDQDVTTPTVNYTVSDLGGSNGPLSNAKANEIRELWARYHNSAVADTSGTKAAAFQMALWEIVSDNDLNLSSGTFSVDTTTATDVAVKAQAASYLSHLTGCGPKANLLALTNCTNQDQVFEVGCTPPPISITHHYDGTQHYHCYFNHDGNSFSDRGDGGSHENHDGQDGRDNHDGHDSHDSHDDRGGHR